MADQLWIVFLDDVAQTGVLPYADSEDKALSMWREQAALGPIARARLRAAPKADDRAAKALTIVRDIAHRLRDEDEEINGGDFLDHVSRELDEAGFLAEARAGVASQDAGTQPEPVQRSGPDELTAEEQIALRAWADEQRPRWRAALRLAWETGNYGGSEHDSTLQRIRNRLGPSWLEKYRLPVDPRHETKGYSCWVVTSRKPRQVDTWVATRRAEAISRVKETVRDKKTEGGVESKDPRYPFEVTFALVRGKLVTTKHTD